MSFNCIVFDDNLGNDTPNSTTDILTLKRNITLIVFFLESLKKYILYCENRQYQAYLKKKVYSPVQLRTAPVLVEYIWKPLLVICDIENNKMMPYIRNMNQIGNYQNNLYC